MNFAFEFAAECWLELMFNESADNLTKSKLPFSIHHLTTDAANIQGNAIVQIQIKGNRYRCIRKHIASNCRHYCQYWILLQREIQSVFLEIGRPTPTRGFKSFPFRNFHLHNSHCHYVEDLMLLWELESPSRGSVIY